MIILLKNFFNGFRFSKIFREYYKSMANVLKHKQLFIFEEHHQNIIKLLCNNKDI